MSVRNSSVDRLFSFPNERSRRKGKRFYDPLFDSLRHKFLNWRTKCDWKPGRDDNRVAISSMLRRYEGSSGEPGENSSLVVEDWMMRLDDFFASFAAEDSENVLNSVRELLKLVEPPSSFPDDCVDHLFWTPFFENVSILVSVHDQELVSDSVLLLSTMLNISGYMTQRLFESGFLLDLFQRLCANDDKSHLFFVFSNIIRYDEALYFFLPLVSPIIASSISTETDLCVLFSACFCCQCFSIYGFNREFVESLLIPFKTIITRVLNETFETSVLLIRFICESIINVLTVDPSVMTLLVEAAFPSFLLGIIPAVSEPGIILIFQVLKKCLKLGPGEGTLRFLDCAELVRLLESENLGCFKHVCNILEILCCKDVEIIGRLFELGLVDQICKRVGNGMAFVEKKAVVILIRRIVLKEQNDETLRPLLRREIFELCLEIHDLNPGEIRGLLATITRFHVMTFDVPDLHKILAEYVESSFDTFPSFLE
jgi:hypothetical protein